MPVAAKKYPAKDLKFPFIFELETKDLLFPYTADAWKERPQAKDTIAMYVYWILYHRYVHKKDRENLIRKGCQK